MAAKLTASGPTHHQRDADACQPEDLTIGGRLVQHIDKLLAQTDEEGLVVDAAAATVGLAILGKAEDEIDIGGEVKLSPTQHPCRLQRLRLTIGLMGVPCSRQALS